MGTLAPKTPASAAPPVREVLTGIAQALDKLGVLVLHLAETAGREDDDPLLTVAEAARELRFSPSHIRAKCTSGELEALNDGGWRIRRSALKRYEQRRTGR